MSWRPTALNLSFLTLGGWALFLGVLAGRADLVVVAIPLIVALLAARLARMPSGWRITHEVSGDRVFEGDGVTVDVTLRATTPIPLIELRLPLPPHVRVTRGSARAFFTLGAGQAVHWTVELSCAVRQRVRLPGVGVRLWETLGLASAESDHPEPRTVSVYPRITPLRFLPRPARTRTFVGDHVSPTQGEGIEPGEIRPFVAGDQVRHVNWRATLRRGELHVTQHHRERNADVILVLDTLSAPGRAGATTLDLAVRGAASLAAAYLARKDRVGLIEYGGLLRWVTPGSGRAHLHRLLDTMLHASVTFTYVARDLDLIPPRALPPQALVIALSPLLDPRFVRVAADLAARRFDLVVIAVSPVGPARASVRASGAVGVAARLWELERRGEMDDLRRRGLTIVPWDGVTPLPSTLALLRRPRRRAIVLG